MVKDTSVSILYGSDIKQSQGGGSAKLTLHQMKEIVPDNKRLYLTK